MNDVSLSLTTAADAEKTPADEKIAEVEAYIRSLEDAMGNVAKHTSGPVWNPNRFKIPST